jgi:hypothetical protein
MIFKLENVFQVQISFRILRGKHFTKNKTKSVTIKPFFLKTPNGLRHTQNKQTNKKLLRLLTALWDAQEREKVIWKPCVDMTFV